MAEEPIVDYWLITYKKIGRLPHLLEQLRKSPVPYKITVLDNSTDEAFVNNEVRPLLQEGEDLLVSPQNLMCCAGSQHLLNVTKAPFIGYLCANHTEINDPTWVLDCLYGMQNDPQIAMCGCVKPTAGLYAYKAHWSHPNPQAFFPYTLPKLEANFTREQIFELANTQIHVQGGMWFGRRDALRQIGGFETALPHLFMDVEIAIRLQCYGFMLGHVPSIYSSHVASEAVPNHRDFKLCHYYYEKPEDMPQQQGAPNV